MDRDDSWGGDDGNSDRDGRDGALSDLEEQPRRSSRIGLVVAVVGLLVAGVASVSYLSVSSGAGSPEDAVTALASAISDEDLLGVLDALAPSERSILRDTVEDITTELRRLEVLDDDVDLSGIDGLDLELVDLEMTTRTLGDGVALVRVDGTATFGVTASELPSGEVIEEEFDPSRAGATSETQPIQGLELVTIEEGGRWYVSVFYSIADAARRSADLPPPDFGNGVRPDGEDTPEEVARALLEAGTALDVERAMQLIDPEEGRVLHDYAPLFLDDARRAAAEARDDVEIDVREFETRTDRDGDEASVEITRFEATIRTEEGDTDVDFDGSCGTVRTPEGTESTCEGESAPLYGLLGDDQPLRLATVERDGEWFLSPLHTIFDPIVEALRRVERSDLETLGDLLLGFVGAAEPGEMVDRSSGGSAFDGTAMTDRGVQSNLRNGFVAFMVAFTDTGEWPTDPRVLSDIEPALLFFPYSSGSIPPGIISFEVAGERVRLASRAASGCFYLEGRAGGAVAYASDPACGPPSEQSYDDSW